MSLSNRKKLIDLSTRGGVVVAIVRRGAFGKPRPLLAALSRLGEKIRSYPGIRVVLDLGSVDTLSSPGLGRLVALLRDARGGDGDLVLARPNAGVLEILQSLKLDRVFTITSTVEEALLVFDR